MEIDYVETFTNSTRLHTNDRDKVVVAILQQLKLLPEDSQTAEIALYVLDECKRAVTATKLKL